MEKYPTDNSHIYFSCIAGMGSVLDEFQTHRPLIACTVIGLIRAI